MKKYYFDYDGLKVAYIIESDGDGNKAKIISIDGLGVDVDHLTLKDMEFIAEIGFADLQFHQLSKNRTNTLQP